MAGHAGASAVHTAMASYLTPKGINRITDNMVENAIKAARKLSPVAKGTLEAGFIFDGDAHEDADGGVVLLGSAKTLPVPQAPGGDISGKLEKKWERTREGSVRHFIILTLEID